MLCRRLNDDSKMAIDLRLKGFIQISPLNELNFDTKPTDEEKNYLCKLITEYGILWKDDDSERVIIYKEAINEKYGVEIPELQITDQTLHIAIRTLDQLFYTNKFLHNHLTKRSLFDITKNSRNGKIGYIIPQVPPKGHGEESILRFRRSLPIYDHRERIISEIERNRIIILTSQTGSGKTTQIPQYILEHHQKINKPCSIIVTEPRRIAAVVMANRIAYERGEETGQTVGYQIRLESKLSPKTLLTFCTNGVLIRTLISSKTILNNITHIIIDEVHERDYQTDLLMLYFKELMSEFSQTKFIFTSASLDSDKLSRYLFCCPIINVPGKLFEVKQYFLEDVLKMINYKSGGMKFAQNYLISGDDRNKKLDNKWANDLKLKIKQREAKEEQELANSSNSSSSNNSKSSAQTVCSSSSISDETASKVDNLLEEAMKTGKLQHFKELSNYITKKIIPVDYKHSVTGITALHTAIVNNMVRYVEEFLYQGASISCESTCGYTAIDWAKEFKRTKVLNLLEAYLKFEEHANSIDEFNKTNKKVTMCDPNRLLDLYLMSNDQSSIDVKLICELIIYIFKTWPIQPKKANTILVFLPGYQDIIELSDCIYHKMKSEGNKLEKFIIYTIHSQISTADQKKMFEKTQNNTRKVILSTNISETSITIDDVGFVIDSGRVKETFYDPLNDYSTLTLFWASKSSVIQRKGRAGRCHDGHSFHLFTDTRFNEMEEFQSPIMQRMPLYEICLQAKLLLNDYDVEIEYFLSKALDPPNSINIQKSMERLYLMDTLNPNGSLSELGVHLLDIPLSPCLGKMILYGVILKCLDPILTIACALGQKDPFPLVNKKRRIRQIEQKIALVDGAYSDHLVLLRIYQEWQAYQRGDTNYFNYDIDIPTMHMICAMRSKVLGQLRASGYVRTKSPHSISDLNKNSFEWQVVKAAICAGGYPNILDMDKEFTGEESKRRYEIAYHPSSVFQNLKWQSLPTKWLTYHQKVKFNNSAFLQCCTIVSPLTVAMFSGLSKSTNLKLRHQFENQHETKGDDESIELNLDKNIQFSMSKDLAWTVVQLRDKISDIFQRRMIQPNQNEEDEADQQIIETIVQMLAIEEQSYAGHVKIPHGVGQRPSQMNQVFNPILLTNSGDHANPSKNY